jgi:hypothetical protein
MPNRTKNDRANQMRAEGRWKTAREKSVIDENNNDFVMINNEVELNDDVLKESSILICCYDSIEFTENGEKLVMLI